MTPLRDRREHWMMPRSLILTIPVLGPLLSCQSPSNADTDDSTSSQPTPATTTGDVPEAQLAPPCPSARLVGRFDVAEELDYSAVSGRVSDGVYPNTVLEELGAFGSCRLLRRNNPVCDPPCSTGETCDHDGNCIAEPQVRSVGTVTVDGLLVDVQMEPVGAGNYFDTTVPHPVMQPGETIELRADGSEIEAFTLRGFGVEPLPSTFRPWELRRGEPISHELVPGHGTSQISVTLSVDQHGLTPGTLACTFPDAARFEISAAAVDALLDLGVSGFPNAHILRHTTDSVDVDEGCVEFRVSSHRSLDVALAD